MQGGPGYRCLGGPRRERSQIRYGIGGGRIDQRQIPHRVTGLEHRKKITTVDGLQVKQYLPWVGFPARFRGGSRGRRGQRYGSKGRDADRIRQPRYHFDRVLRRKSRLWSSGARGPSYTGLNLAHQVQIRLTAVFGEYAICTWSTHCA